MKDINNINKDNISKKERKPMYPKEKLGRLSKWFFGLPLIYTLWIVFSLAMPRISDGLRAELFLNIISYMFFIVIALVVIKRFIGFPISKMLGENGKLDKKGLAIGFAVMLALELIINFVSMIVYPQNFTYTLETYNSMLWLLDWFLALILVILAAFLEELLCRAYIAYFLSDNMETRPLQMLYYCIVSAILFALAHFSNPEVAGPKAFYAMAFYFMMGFTLMLITLKRKSIGAALGIHIANNIINAWFFTYEDAALKTNALFTQGYTKGPMLLVEAAICLVVCTLVLLKPISKNHTTASKTVQN